MEIVPNELLIINNPDLLSLYKRNYQLYSFDLFMETGTIMQNVLNNNRGDTRSNFHGSISDNLATNTITNKNFLLNKENKYFAFFSKADKAVEAVKKTISNVEIVCQQDVELDKLLAKQQSFFFITHLSWISDSWVSKKLGEVVQQCDYCYTYFYIEDKLCPTCTPFNDRSNKVRKIRTEGFLVFPIQLKNNQSGAAKIGGEHDDSIGEEECSDRLKIYNGKGQLIHDINISISSILSISPISSPASSDTWYSYLDVGCDDLTLVIQKNEMSCKKNANIQFITTSTEKIIDYDHRLRPQLRFSQPHGWVNDPNGLVYHKGLYHFFWQYNPFGNNWDNMYWGHAVSTDLISWKNLPIAIRSRTSTPGLAFSGSAISLPTISDGYGKDIIIVFTDTELGELIAISKDDGISWNVRRDPIFKDKLIGRRDPKIVKVNGFYLIVISVNVDGQKGVNFYTCDDIFSRNERNEEENAEWTFRCRIENFGDCPELFMLKNSEDRERWILFSADNEYIVGDFEGYIFKPCLDCTRRSHFGLFGASQCFNQTEPRVIQIGWIPIKFTGVSFNGAFSLPLELTLGDSDRLLVNPVRELAALRILDQHKEVSMISVDKLFEFQIGGVDVFEIIIIIDHLISVESITITFGNNVLIYRRSETANKSVTMSKTKECIPQECVIHLIVDRPMYEVFLDMGTSYTVYERNDPGHHIDTISVESTHPFKIQSLNFYPLKSVTHR